MVARPLDVHDEVVDNSAKTGGSLNGAAIGNETHCFFLLYEGLPAAIVAKRFLAVETQRVHDRQVVEREQAGVLAG